MMDEPVKYYEDYLSKKEGKGKWVDYWVVIRGSWMLFYSCNKVTDRSNFRGSLELLKNTKYSVGKRRSYSFPFYLTTQRGTHLFKCPSNLKRHQWMYVLGLAIKHYPPLPPPSFVPRVTVKDDEGNYVSSWDTNKESGKINNGLSNEDDVDDDDDDDTSLPPGVILVSTLPDDLASGIDGDDEKEKLLNSINKSSKDEQIVLPSNAVLSTGITGTTSIINKKGKNDLLSGRTKHLCISKPLPKTLSKSTGSIKEEFITSQYSILSTSSSWLEQRPSTSPFSSTLHRSPLKYNGGTTTSMNNLKFSRHMTNSAPDVKLLSCDD